jgi:hypothetical protein
MTTMTVTNAGPNQLLVRIEDIVSGNGQFISLAVLLKHQDQTVTQLQREAAQAAAGLLQEVAASLE